MRLFNQNEGKERMNALAKAGAPFLFIISYNKEKAYVERLSELNPEECLFQFGKRGNVSAEAAPLQKTIEWQSYPPSEKQYRQELKVVQDHINLGNSYLANLTEKVPIETNLSLREIFDHSKAMYRLWVKNQFVCFSPEIFVRMDNGIIRSYPMKGTIDATVENAEKELMEDRKEAAEHATIVDLIRNDLGMVADHIKVTRYRYVDRLTTNKGAILQTSSEISGTVPEENRERIGDIIYQLLPAGSITGAPKRKTVEIIEEAESYQRNFYTGVMGVYDRGSLDSAVMIRFVEQEDGKFFFKAGGGITAQSEWEKEYEEIKQKVYVPIY